MLSKNRMTNKQTFNTTIITDIYDRYSKYECDNIKGYKQHLKTNPNMVELIGAYGQQIKPVFDVDAYNNDIDINAVISKINEVFPNKDVYYAKRESREHRSMYKEIFQVIKTQPIEKAKMLPLHYLLTGQ